VLKNELPEGWKLGKLGEIGEIILGVTYKSHEVSEIPKTGYIPILRTNNINYELNFDDVVYVPEKCINQKQLIKAGDIVIAMSSGSKKIVGKAAQSSVDVPFAFGAFCGLFRCNSHIDTRYIGFFFKTPRYRSEISHLSRGANSNNLRKDNIRNITIPVPPLETQHKIVAILEKVEATQRLRAEADALTQELVQSVFLEMFGDPVTNPMGWDVVQIGDAVKVISGHGFKLNEYSEDGIKLLQINNVTFGKIIWENIAYLPENYGNDYPNLVLKENDILIALNRPILGNKIKVGMMNKNDSPSILYQRVGKMDIIDENRLNRHYLYYFLRSKFFISELSSRLCGSDQPYINPTAMVKIRLPLPPISLQQKFAQIIKSLDSVSTDQSDVYRNIDDLFLLLQSKAFTGELIP